MAYRPHPRHITNEQFSDNTTVDGSRIDSAIESVERHFNNVPQGDIRSKWVPTTYVMSWIPNNPLDPNPLTHRFPWLQAVNDSSMVTGIDPDTFSNPLRVKGFEIPDVGIDIGQNSQFQWDTAFAFERPAIITSLDVMLIIDGAGAILPTYRNSFEYGANPPHGFSSGERSKDFNFCLHVDSPTGPEDRQLNDIESIRHAFTVKASSISNVPHAAPFPDFSPAGFPGGPIAGVYEPVNIDIPLHRNSRVRLDLTIPPFVTTYDSSWGNLPWYMQQFHVSMTVLEELV